MPDQTTGSAVTPNSSGNGLEQNGAEQAGALTPALIREVTEKVYRLMQRDLDLAQQRTRAHYRGKRGVKGNIR